MLFFSSRQDILDNKRALFQCFKDMVNATEKGDQILWRVHIKFTATTSVGQEWPILVTLARLDGARVACSLCYENSYLNNMRQYFNKCCNYVL